MLTHRLNARYAEHEGALRMGNLMALPARYVLNIVYAELMQWSSKEDREDILGWCTCTVAEAKEFQKEQTRQDAAERLQLARMAGEVVI